MDVWIIVGGLLIASLPAIILAFRMNKPQGDDPTVVATLVQANRDLVDRLMGFTAEGREHAKLLSEIDQLKDQNAQHLHWRSVAAADRRTGPTPEDNPTPAIWQEGPQGGV